MLQCSENVATVHKKMSIMFKKVYYAHYVVLIIDDTGQVKGKTYTVQLKCIACLFHRILLASEMWIYHSHLEYEHSYHQVCILSIMHFAKDNGEPVKSNTHSCHKLMAHPDVADS